MLTGAMEAEKALFKSESQWMDDVVDELPDDSPVKAEASKQKSLLGDLSGLPPGHPLIVALEDAKLRYESEIVSDDRGKDEQSVVSLRRAKKIDKRSRYNDRIAEEEEGNKLRDSIKSYNSYVGEAIESVGRLRRNVSASRDDFSKSRYAMMKLSRLEKMLIAVERGFSESILSAGRVLDNG